MESIFFEFIFFAVIKKRLEEALFTAWQKINLEKILKWKAGNGYLLFYFFADFTD
jgi:hypothetical protein